MPLIRSWVDSANARGAEFPLNNLPCGVFDDGGGARMGVAIGDAVLDVGRVDHGLDPALFAAPSWNAVMAAGPAVWQRLRARLTELLSDPAFRDAVAPHLIPLDGVRLLLPFQVSEFTDFYASRHHAENVGRMFRGPENALPPNWLSMPIGYNGRASSVVVSGTRIRRPWGQVRADGDDLPRLEPSSRLDFELELGAVVGQPSDGPVTVAQADAMIFGYVLLNDWSVRDIQSWEYQPLGPFQSKAAATTIGPWIVTAAALAPFRVAAPPRDRPLLPYLSEPGPMLHDIALEVALTTAEGDETVLCRTNARELYYSPAQQLAHHALSGCPMRVGDLLGSGTISGPGEGTEGSLLELSRNGREPVPLSGGGSRAFVQDGDSVTLRGTASGDGFGIGFGACTGKVRPALADPFAPGGSSIAD